MPGHDALVRFEQQINNVPQEVMPEVARALGRGLEYLQGVIQVIPPQPPRNRAKAFNTYVRGVGRLPKSAFLTKTGKARKSIKTKGARQTSQKSAQRWRVAVQETEGRVEGSLENTASYSGWVWGPEDQSQDPHQVPWHTETGWVSADEAMSQAVEHMDWELDHILDTMLNKLTK